MEANPGLALPVPLPQKFLQGKAILLQPLQEVRPGGNGPVVRSLKFVNDMGDRIGGQNA